MATVVRKEIRKRGFFGWLFFILFLAFNAFMLWAMIVGLSSVGDGPAATEAEQTGRAVGGAIGVMALLVIWAMGAVILGLLAILTRGRKTIVEETVRG
ncbi:hypothetical protein [Mesorhizobium sp.]|uniref:hypothetical protein n=1 Tax=Mesorhizobium sp. TaxID=1871066 RepID=UPI00120CCA8E|nr:hypothetical protein [Mesorhizobium sp.]TIO30415.1 MAG: hypothetical protein E5X89_27270 [Mesorhizobium sp.]